ncbi:MAG TPA: GYD domain-containing protein [Candidatus Acidoferrales bacterium]|nr:GYD domain-containing protein [Candidatus Acidoferrales bacterium]
MPHFLLQAAYTPEAVQALLRNPQDRTAALRAPIEKLGGKIHNIFLSFGDYDAVAILEMPDNVAAAAIALAISSGGACKTVKTTPLLTGTEAIEAAKKGAGSGYRSMIASA